jgi:hypothetical protein
MKKHLRILYGADDRFELVKNTILVSYKYFDTVRIVNSGPKSLSVKLRETLPNSVMVEDLNYFFGDLDAARRSMYYDIDDGDWFMWLDSDERPSQILLDNLDNLIYDAESDRSTSCSFYNFHHSYDEESQNLNYDGSFGYPWNWMNHYFNYKHWFPKNKDEALNNRIPHWPRLCKKTKYTEPHNNFGGHGAIMSTLEYNQYTFSQYPMLHYKHPVMTYQSHVTSTYFNVCVNISYKNCVTHVINSPQFKLIRDFQRKSGVYLNNDLCQRLHIDCDADFKSSLKDLASNPILVDETYFGKYTDSTYYKSWPIWSTKFDLSWDTPPIYCGFECCKFNNIQL